MSNVLEIRLDISQINFSFLKFSKPIIQEIPFKSLFSRFSSLFYNESAAEMDGRTDDFFRNNIDKIFVNIPCLKFDSVYFKAVSKKILLVLPK